MSETPGSSSCPETFQQLSDEQIGDAFQSVYEQKKLNLNVNSKDSLFGKVAKFLTKQNESTLAERRYLHKLWLEKYKVLKTNHTH